MRKFCVFVNFFKINFYKQINIQNREEITIIKKIKILLIFIIALNGFINFSPLNALNSISEYDNISNNYWRDKFSDYTLVENTSNILIKNSEAKIIGPGLNYFHTGYEITPNKQDSWQKIGVSELVPKNATGVILELINTHIWRQNNIAVRKPGSSDPFTFSKIKPKSHIYALCGVDDNLSFEAYLQSKKCQIFIVGWTDSAVYFYENRIDKSLSKSGSWIEMDLSYDIPEDATGVIFQIVNTNKKQFLQSNDCKGSIRTYGSDNHADNSDICDGGGKIYALCGINDGKIEAFIESGREGKIKHYLVGYTKYPVTFFKNYNLIEINDIDEWKSIDVRIKTSNDTNGLIFCIRNKDQKPFFSNHQGVLRMHDSFDDKRTNSNIIGDGHIWALVGTNNEQIFDIYKNHDDIYFWMLGYSEGIRQGSIFSKPIEPSDLKKWCSFGWNDITSVNTNIQYYLEYYFDGNWELIPDDDLLGNSNGFNVSPVELSDLDVVKYGKIRLKAIFSTRNPSFTPKLKDWGVTWQSSDSEWEDYFLTDYMIKSFDYINVKNDVSLDINHSNWYTYGGNKRRSGVPELDIGPTTNNVLWRANVSGVMDAFGGAIVVNGVVYVSGNYIISIDKEGNWHHHPGHPYTFALDAVTGEKIWMSPTGSVDDVLTYYDGKIFVQENIDYRPERLWCLDAVDGSPLWVFDENDCGIVDLGKSGGTPTIAEDKRLVIALSNTYLYGINITTGKKAWSVKLSNARKTPTSPVYHNGVVYAGCKVIDKFGDWLYAYEVFEDHVELKWSMGGSNRLFGTDGLHDSSPVIYNYKGNDRLYIGCMDGNIHEIDIENGCILRTYNTLVNFWITGTPSISKDVLYVGGLYGYMYAVTLSDFSLKWRKECGKSLIKCYFLKWLDSKRSGKVGIYTTAAIAEGTVYYGSLDKYVYAASENDGDLIWKYNIGEKIYGQSAIADGVLYILSDGWYLYAFGPESGPSYRYYNCGNITSVKIKKSSDCQWDKFYVNDSLPDGTNITYHVLDENNNFICNVENGDNISDISQDSIRLYASLNTKDIKITPVINSWSVTNSKL